MNQRIIVEPILLIIVYFMRPSNDNYWIRLITLIKVKPIKISLFFDLLKVPWDFGQLIEKTKSKFDLPPSSFFGKNKYH